MDGSLPPPSFSLAIRHICFLGKNLRNILIKKMLINPNLILSSLKKLEIDYNKETEFESPRQSM